VQPDNINENQTKTGQGNDLTLFIGEMQLAELTMQVLTKPLSFF
jgi:hypothetical protein